MNRNVNNVSFFTSDDRNGLVSESLPGKARRPAVVAKIT
jgi:hypothetical protein